MRKCQLLKYLKKKVLLVSLEKSRESKRITIKVTNEGAKKDLGTRGLVEDLNIVLFVRKDIEEKDRKYDKYAARRPERNLRTKAHGQYVFGISEETNLKPRVSMPIIFTDEDLVTVKLPHANPLVIKLRIGDSIVSRVLINGGSSSDVIFWICAIRLDTFDVFTTF